MKITVHPGWLAGPRRHRQRRLPYRERWADIETVPQSLGGRSGVVITSHERNAAELMDRTPGRVNRLQGSDEPSQAHCHPVHIGDRCQRRELALQPGTHRPMPRIPIARHAVPERKRDSHRQMRGENRKPLVLLADLLSADATARKPDREVGSQPEDRVVPPSRLDRLYSQTRPLRKLRGHEAADERDVDVHFGGRSGTWHGIHLELPTATRVQWSCNPGRRA